MQTFVMRASRGLIEIYISTGKPGKSRTTGRAVRMCKLLSARAGRPVLPACNEGNTRDSAHQKAIPLFEKYLAKFPSNGRYTNEVKNYLANSYYVTGDVEKSVELYKETLEGQNTGFTELAAGRVAHHLYNEGKYEEVIKYYNRLENSEFETRP